MAGIVEKIKGFLFSPSETFDASKEDTLGDAFKYYIILLLIPALLSAVIAAVVFLLFPESFEIIFEQPFKIMFRSIPAIAIAGVVAAVAFIAVLILETIGVIIGGLWLHIWVYLVGGRKGLTQTLKASMYGETPYLLLCRIPDILAVIWLYLVIGETPSVTRLLAAIWALNIIIGIKSLIAIWALIVTIFGIRQLHEISTGRAVAAGILAIIPLIVLLVLFVILRPAMMPTMPYGHGIGGHYWHRFP